MTTIDFTKFKNTHYREQLTRSAPPPALRSTVTVIIGGTGAVGGQVLIELLGSMEQQHFHHPAWAGVERHIVATGLDREEIERFRTKLYRPFGGGTSKGHGFEEVEGTGDVVLRRASGITLHFKIFRLTTSMDTRGLEALLSAHAAEGVDRLLEAVERAGIEVKGDLFSFVSGTVDGLGGTANSQCAVVSGIPIPSVAAYHFQEVDALMARTGTQRIDADKAVERAIKTRVMRSLASQFGAMRTSLGAEVVIAHTTAVGGMYAIENGTPRIRLGYAHSAQDGQLLEKQFYANLLTEAYSAQGLKTLITAAAIGVDGIFPNGPLPIDKTINGKLQEAIAAGTLPFPAALLAGQQNLVFPAVEVSPAFPLADAQGAPVPTASLRFAEEGHNPPPKLRVDLALRSGENGLFSVDNAYALYLNMKVATQEELAHIIAYNVLFGDDAQRPWFDADGVCYQTETENASLVFALLNNRAEFRRYQLSAFTPKAFQALGSSKHQGELHTWGLYMLRHRLKHVDLNGIAERVTSKYTEPEVMEFIDRNSTPLTIEDLLVIDPQRFAAEFAELLDVRSAEDMARFMGFQGNLDARFIRVFFQHLAGAVRRVVDTIVSLGTPILFQRDGRERLLTGPYAAPITCVIHGNDTFADHVKKEAARAKARGENVLDWLVANNGIVDLRPTAVVTTARSHLAGLDPRIWRCTTEEAFIERVRILQQEQRRGGEVDHMTSSGIIAVSARMKGLYAELRRFDLSLGSLNTWRALFPTDNNGRHLVLPGLFEAMRMYTEGLGKITGFEVLYPGFGYFQEH
ncbi:MAG: hypothetical protein JST66_11745 [Bacteroidetes bacterium]|nr:hypothetical protein [Bacteroidota bacterium]